jgi:hypothetical protein
MNDIKIGDTVRVPNGEIGRVVDTFRKDGDDRVEVEFTDETSTTFSAIDVEIVR